jgi:hypothetical protein
VAAGGGRHGGTTGGKPVSTGSKGGGGNPAKGGGKPDDSAGTGKPGGPAARAARVSERRKQVEAMRRAQARRDRIRVSALITGVALVAVAVIVLAIVFAGGSGSSGSSASGGDATIDRSSSLLATTAGQVKGESVDGITCDTNEQVATHVHAHLAVYVNGAAKAVPYGIGILGPYKLDTSGGSPFVAGGSCFYWLHTHDETGVLHIESPTQGKTFTLGQLFDEWKQPLSATQVGPAKGTVTAVVNGKTFGGDPRSVPLAAHNVIQLNVGTVVPFKNYTFANGL